MGEHASSSRPRAEAISMPKPVPIPVREKLWERAALGESVASLAEFYRLSPRTVRHLLKRARERGDSGLLPGYRAPSALDHAYPDQVREAVLASRRDHPSWRSELVRVMLAEDRPQVAWPSSQTIRRWSRATDLAPSPATASDLADRRLRAHPDRGQVRGLLASDRRRGDRVCPADGRFPPSGSGPRSIPEKPGRP
jgi:hypothetical protein